MKKLRKFMLAPCLLVLASCAFGGGVNNNSTKGSAGSNPYTNSTDTSYDYSGVDVSSLDVDDNSVSSIVSDDASSITDLSLANIAYSDNTFTISGAGTFAFTGSFNGNIVVDAGDDDEIEIDLNGFSIQSTTNSPIFIKNASEIKIKLEKGTSNYVYDNRSKKTEDDDMQGNGAIYSKADLKFTGKGSLTVVGDYNNGIHSTKDLKLKATVDSESKIQVTALNTALKGNDSVTMESGNVIAISTGGDGVKTEDTDVSSKGNQRGTFTMTGGQLDIYSCCDAVQASYNIDIENGTDDEGNVTIPVLNAYTSNYSSYSGEVVDLGDTTMYLKTTSYSTSYRFACLFSDSSGNETWSNATYLTSRNEGRGQTSYYFSLERPSSATKVKVYEFASSSTDNDASSAKASMSQYQNINTNYDTLVFTVSSSTINYSSWTSYSSSQSQGPGGGGMGGGGQGGGGWGNMDDGNNDKSEYSAKGLKAENIISIGGGVINIKAYDDAVHANYGTPFDNGESGLGDVVISGGDLSLYSADDGLHADRYLTINGGDIDITNAYEGVEGNYITIAGGYTKVYSTDDGVNAANKSGLSPVVKVTGGVLDVIVYGNDVDGIDSNGSYTQSGGFVITKGANSNMSTGLDCDSTASISGGSLVCFGKPESSPSCSSGVSSKTLSGSYSAGTYTVTNGSDSYTTTTKYSYTAIYLYSDSVNSISVAKN